MPGILNKVLNFVGWDTESDEDYDDFKSESYGKVKKTASGNVMENVMNDDAQNAVRKPKNKIVNLKTQALMRVVVVNPVKFDEAQEICDHLKDNRTVIVNLETVDKETAQRIVDFLGGSVYALDGNIQKVSASIFLIAPVNVDIMGDFKDDLKNRGSFPWLK
ncbi:MAG: cell division protein SepF [Eubacteriales bacterium]|nr:cell division protein SepF [Eubacteriales bacterium]